ncbi:MULTISPECIES: hypothetical protein [unclassified Brevundimonas]|uniref:hypothetical protein n=1 Tax=unclassified Brevundimonas TaxID=2622653 RepID=UPI000E82DF5F|nr:MULTISPECIES: hypothetical protein [unclassified Brevundimonas]MCK6104315.1 hypothetical protein [Brevundimonas sp. EYE_349]HBI18312.1 hypothetical protein [Brevundimonas sp.]
MFEFGRDLRKLFAQARESEDLGWVELIGPDLLRAEALRESIDAGRVSCNRPFETEHRAAALWREHARRTGAAESLDRADRCADSLSRSATTQDQAALAAADGAASAMLRFDLCGAPERLDRALALLASVNRPRSRRAASTLAAIHARLKARTARLAGDVDSLAEAGGLMEAAVQGDTAEDLELRMDQAALALETGVVRREVRLLDQAGRSLGALVETASPDHRPLTRARALALCGAGLSALAAVAGHQGARAQARSLFDAAAEQFTPDHSPLDWVAIQILRAGDEAQPLMLLAQAESLTQGRDLVLGAAVRERRITREVALAEAVGDLAGMITLETRLRARMPDATPLDWSADQIGMAEILLARQRLTGSAAGGLGLMLGEAATTARERGVDVLAERAEALLSSVRA